MIDNSGFDNIFFNYYILKNREKPQLAFANSKTEASYGFFYV